MKVKASTREKFAYKLATTAIECGELSVVKMLCRITGLWKHGTTTIEQWSKLWQKSVGVSLQAFYSSKRFLWSELGLDLRNSQTFFNVLYVFLAVPCLLMRGNLALLLEEPSGWLCLLPFMGQLTLADALPTICIWFEETSCFDDDSL